MSEKFANLLMEAKNPESTTFKSIIAIISTVSLIFIIRKIYKAIQFERANPRFIPKGKSASEFYKADGRKITTTTKGNECTLFLWMYVDNMNTRYGQLKHVVTKGSSGYYSRNQCPSLWIKPRENDLKVVVSTDNKNDTFEIKDFPIRYWFSIAIVLKGDTVDLYKDGLLTSSHPLSGTPKLNGSDLIINKKKGYEGAIQCVRWFSTALDANTVLLYHRIYKEPLFFELAWDYFTGLEMPKPPSVKINLKVDVSVGKETSKDAKEKKIKKLRNKSN